MDNSSDSFHRGPDAESLRKAEENAKDAKLEEVEDSTSGAQKAETGVSVPQGFYRAGAAGKKGSKFGFLKGAFKHKGATGLIIGGIFAMMVGVAGSQSMQVFSVAAQLKETFNSTQVSTAMRANNTLRFQLKPTEKIKEWGSKLFGKNDLGLSETQQTDLEEKGLKYDGEDENVRTLSYEGDEGKTVVITAENVDDAIETDANFSNKYTSGSKSWRGAIANWFNRITEKFLNSNNLTRHLFNRFSEKVAESDGNALEVMEENLKTRGNADITTKVSQNTVHEEKKTTNADGTVTTEVLMDKEEDVKLDGEKIKQDIGTAEIKEKVADIAKGMSMANQVVNIRCTVGNVLNAINLLVMAKETLQVINLTSGYLEGIDKAKAGDGIDSPINEIGNTLNQKKGGVYTTYDYSNSSGQELVDSNGSNDDSKQSQAVLEGFKVEEKETIKSDKTAMESAGIVSLYSGQPIKANDPSVKEFNFTANINDISKALGLTTSNFVTCLQVKAVVGTLNGILGLIPGVGQGWSVAKAFLNAGISGLISTAVQALVPMIAGFWMRDLISNLGGESLGNALTSGANIYMGSMHRANGGSPSTKDEYIEYAAAHEQVIAENARYERENKSPFDATSKYTFMGNIARQLYSLSLSNSFLGTIASAATTLSSSVMNLTPAALAYDIESELKFSDSEEFKERCPYLASVGAVGDAFCNPYVITDTSTIAMDPGEVADEVKKDLDEDGKIKKDSELARYIAFCNNRTSVLGIPDNQVSQKLSSSGSYALDTIIGQVPGLNIAQDLWESNQGLGYLGYITGESCVAGNDMNLDGNGVENKAPKWEDTAKYYQRFIEDQALFETMGITDKSVVTAFLEEYYEENPVDNSYEGILARYSGLSKDEVIAYLDFMDYCEYVANYDASERYAFNQDDIDLPEKPLVEEKDFDEALFVLLSNITYADVRNRQTIA